MIHFNILRECIYIYVWPISDVGIPYRWQQWMVGTEYHLLLLGRGSDGIHIILPIHSLKCYLVLNRRLGHP